MYQPVAIDAVQEGVVETFLACNSLQEMVVGVASLHAVLAGQVLIGDDQAMVENAMALERILDDLRDALGLEDAPIRGQFEPCEFGLDDGTVAGAAETSLALFQRADQAVDVAHRLFAVPQCEQRGPVQHLAEVDRGIGAGQVQFKAEGLGQRFVQGKFDDVEFHPVDHAEGEAQVTLVGHPCLPWESIKCQTSLVLPGAMEGNQRISKLRSNAGALDSAVPGAPGLPRRGRRLASVRFLFPHGGRPGATLPQGSK